MNNSYLLTVIVIILYAAFANADEREENAVRALEQFGARVKRDENSTGKQVIELEFGADVTDTALKHLSALKQLQSLEIHDCLGLKQAKAD